MSNIISTQSNNINGLSVTYDYDALNYLQAVTDNRITPGVTTYSYDDTHNLTRTVQPNGVQTDYSYNAVDLLTTLETNKSATMLTRYNYGYTPSRLRNQMTELSGRVVAYEYDDAQRLVRETIANALNSAQNGTVGYVLDAVGNRLQRNTTVAALPSTSNSYNSVDRLNTDVYDANGNTTQADGKTFAYDFRDKIKSVNANIGLVYDGNGNRVGKTIGGVTTNYLVDEMNPTGYSQVVEELASGQVQKVYTYGVMLLNQRQLVGGNWVTHHYGYDGSGNARYLTDASGAVTDTWDYDVYGNIIGRTGTTANNYLYRGQQFDGDLGYYYQRARYYSEARGRFLTMDLFAGIKCRPKTLHKYQYADADPVNKIDPSGLATAVEYGFNTDRLSRQLPALLYLNYAISCTIYATASLIVGFNPPPPYEHCKVEKKKCPDCSPHPAGTIGYIGPHTDHDHYPIGRPHLNLFRVNQNPRTCKCFWNNSIPDAAAPPPDPAWIDLNGGFPPLTP